MRISDGSSDVCASDLGLWILPELGGHFKHDPILARLGKDGGYQALAKRIVQGVIDHCIGNAQARSRIPVYDHGGLQATALQVVDHAPQLWKLTQGKIGSEHV